MMPIFADVSEYLPPAGHESWSANLMYYAVLIAAVSTVIKQWLPKPPLNEQLETIRTWVSTFFTSRTRHDALEKRFDGAHHENLARFSSLADGIEKLRDEIRESTTEITKAGEHRMTKLHSQITEIGIETANQIGQLTGEVRRIK